MVLGGKTGGELEEVDAPSVQHKQGLNFYRRGWEGKLNAILLKVLL